MGRPGPKIEPLHLAERERAELERWVRRRKGAQDMALRARLILACDAIGEDGLPVSTKVVAEEIGVSTNTSSSTTNPSDRSTRFWTLCLRISRRPIATSAALGKQSTQASLIR